jgi:hypothetical protein
MPAVVFVYLLPGVPSAGWRRALLNRGTVLFLTIATLPAFAYYGYGTFIARYFQWKLTSSFMFSLYREGEFWREWFLLATSELGLTALVVACFGLAFVRPGLTRSVIVALGVGYLCFGLAFTYHIHTHGYYQAQLIPAVALAASPVVVSLIRRAFEAPGRWLPAAPVVAAVLIAGSWWIEIRARLNRDRFESATVASEIGVHVQHSDQVVYLSPFYGLPLQYLAEFTGAYWPRASTYRLYRPAGEQPQSIQQRMDALGFDPEYFVITHFREYENNHGDLRAWLEDRCVPFAIRAEYHIYARCDMIRAGAAGNADAGPPR